MIQQDVIHALFLIRPTSRMHEHQRNGTTAFEEWSIAYYVLKKHTLSPCHYLLQNRTWCRWYILCVRPSMCTQISYHIYIIEENVVIEKQPPTCAQTLLLSERLWSCDYVLVPMVSCLFCLLWVCLPFPARRGHLRYLQLPGTRKGDARDSSSRRLRRLL